VRSGARPFRSFLSWVSFLALYPQFLMVSMLVAALAFGNRAA
jgi:hypothetical protein